MNHVKQRLHKIRWYEKHGKKMKAAYIKRYHSDPAFRRKMLRESRRLVLEKQAFLNAFKLEIGCKKCGFNKHPAALEFHHKNPKHKKFCVSYGTHRSWLVLLEEMRKCVVLCSNCHRIETDRKWEKNR